ncbi:hypothetical protein M413DRAFT_32983 [Hebeloma cylindrosporum]|uniref:WW domain-containing protein n=1 Tax=Hebeloma cylindrosporum TaxID=76867 RepID=A0A0C2X9Z3_HEBCY|nr:hypothetical protein M413DRAFT_32983 [Hebeloma cylindrosporum h7]
MSGVSEAKHSHSMRIALTSFQRLKPSHSALPAPALSMSSEPSHFSAEDHSNPANWKIIETHPGGIELEFYNRKTTECTWYTPEGMSATDILAVPDSKKYWSTIEKVERYMRKMAADKIKNGGMDYKDAVAEKEKEEEEVAPWFGIDADDSTAMAADTIKNGGKDYKDAVADKEKGEEEVAPWFGIDADDPIAMAADKIKNGGRDYKNAVAEKKKEEEVAPWFGINADDSTA